MPSSFYDAIPVVLPFVAALRPASVLDVGIGFGKYGLLFREYLDANARPPGGAPFDPKDRQVRIDGVEAYAPYVTELQRAIYDTIYTAEALTVLPELDRYDLVFAADVLEHFSREGGRRFLALGLGRARRGVLIVTPALYFDQEPAFGNAYERHQSFWTAGDFAEYPLADVLVWRRQLVAWLPTDGGRRTLPRPTVREALGLAGRGALARLVGGRRAEAFLQRLRGIRG